MPPAPSSLAGSLRGLAVESAWCAAHLAGYPLDLLRSATSTGTDRFPTGPHYRTGALSPADRGRLAGDLDAEGTPVLLVHGLRDNQAAYTLFRRELRRVGFGLVRAVHFDPLTTDLRTAAHELAGQVHTLREETRAERVHIVAHSVGGLIARYYVQRLGGDAHVHTLATLGTPHGGTLAAYLLPTPLIRQLAPGSELLTELTEPAPGCRTRLLAVWSDLDQCVLPSRSAVPGHPDLPVRALRLPDVGHLSLAVDPRAARWVATALPLLTPQPPRPSR
jgi:pimeloyl-ACP methyl ester carboxylesterase